jgi:hypothetical protein
VAHPVSFIATDDLRQEIPWVQVEKNGELVTYVDSETDPALWDNAAVTTRTMDCIDCHSRDGHMVRKPDQVLDQAMANGLIPADLPYVKAQSLDVLDPQYETKEEGLAAIDTNLREFYQTEYPELFAERQADVERTIEQVQTIFQQTQFPYMNVYWETYPDHVGHEDFPGCWRCHDGNHLNEQNEAIPAECNLCHAIPQVAEPEEIRPAVSVAVGDLPDSHLSSLWIAQHQFQFDATCDDCHTVDNPGGSDNSSFCSNSGCHAREWSYLDIDAPAVLALAVPEQTPSERRLPHISHPLVDEMDCQQCHGLEKVLAFPEDHAEYSQDECTDCHRLDPAVIADQTPSPTAPAAEVVPAPAATTAPMISHALLGNENCLACHAVNSNIAPAPPTHLDFTNETCQSCHPLAPEYFVIPTATPTLSPTAMLLPTTAPSQPTPTTPAASVAVTATPAIIQSPAIPHPVVAWSDCLSCHIVEGGVYPMPSDHATFQNQMCEMCHIAAEESTP